MNPLHLSFYRDADLSKSFRVAVGFLTVVGAALALLLAYALLALTLNYPTAMVLTYFIISVVVALVRVFSFFDGDGYRNYRYNKQRSRR